VDLHHFPLIYFSHELFSNRPGGRKNLGWWVENQGNTWWVSLILLQVMYRYWFHIQYNLHKRTYEYFFLGFVCHYTFHYILLHSICGFSLPMATLIMHAYLYTGGAAIFGQSWFSHSFLDVHAGYPEEDKNTVPRYHYDWIELAACYTVNVTNTPLVKLFVGFLIYQNEHHLWPAIPEANHNEHTAKLVKEFLKRHNMPYYEQTWWNCLVSLCTSLGAVGKNTPYDPWKDLPNKLA